MRAAPLLLALIIGALVNGTGTGGARAGEATCWRDNGAVVVSASLGDIAGDFILDLASPHSQLHLTRAQGDGIDSADAQSDLRLAGVNLGPADFLVVNLDARNWGFPTEISGVIGADVLAGYVVDLQTNPCRIGLWRRHAPRFRAARVFSLRLVDGVPTIRAVAFDGAARRRGRFAIETGGEGVRLGAANASLSRAPAKGVDPASRSEPPAWLRALTLDDRRFDNLPAAIDPNTTDRLGDIGETIWDRYAVRVDLRRKLLELRPPSP